MLQETALGDDCEAGGKGSGSAARAPRLLTVKEVAAILRVCTATVYAMVERGELPHMRVSNVIRIVVDPSQGESPSK